MSAGGGATGFDKVINDAVGHVEQHISVGYGQGLLSFPLLSNHIVMQVLAALILVWIIPRALRRTAGDDAVGRLVPRGLGTAIEGLCVALRNQVGIPNLGPHVDRFMPYLWTVFFFVLTSNLLGMVPLGEAVGLFVDHHHQIGGTSTGNVFVTGTLALLTLTLILYNGLTMHGMAYVKHFFMGPPGFNVFIALLEVFGLGFKTMALAVRLFANMIAGHIVIGALIGFVGLVFAIGGAIGTGGGLLVTLIVIAASVLLNFLELLVAFIQAFIFTLLTAVFLGMAVNIHHDDEHEAEHGEGHGHAAAHATH